MRNYDDSTFQEVKAIIERRFTRRLKFLRRLLMGFLALVAIFAVSSIASNQAYRNYANQWIDWEQYRQYHQMIGMIAMVIIAAVFVWVGFALFEMLTGNAQDRALRQEITEERQWRLRQWESGMYGDVPLPSYLLTDDGEIEEEYYQDKRKRIEM